MTSQRQSAEYTRKQVVLGRITGLYGVKGWVKVFSYTEPRTNVLNYSQWLLGKNGDWEALSLVTGRAQGKAVVALLEGINDRDQARLLMGREIAVPRSQLPNLGVNEYYWSDLENLRVITVDGKDLGRVDRLMETGSNDVLVVEGERQRLIPYILGDVVKNVDTTAGTLTVDWDADF